MPADIRVTGAEQLARLSKALKEADSAKKLPRKLTKAIRDGAKPAVVAAREAIRTLPVTGTRGGGRKQRAKSAFRKSFERVQKRDEYLDFTSDEVDEIEERHRIRAHKRAGLRDSIARAIKTEIKTGPRSAAVRIVVDEKQLPADQRTLPRNLDSTHGWTHPTFGHDPRVTQRGRPWFAATIRKHAGELREQIIKAMDEFAAELEKEGD